MHETEHCSVSTATGQDFVTFNCTMDLKSAYNAPSLAGYIHDYLLVVRYVAKTALYTTQYLTTML